MPDPNSNPAPAPAPAPGTPPETAPAPAPATKEEESFDVKAAIDEMKGTLETQTGEIDGLKARNETLQDSLDTALEELALGGKIPSVEDGLNKPPVPAPAPGTPPEPAPASPAPAPETPPVPGTPPAPEAASDALDKSQPAASTAEKEIESAIQEDRDFREGVLQREEMRDLKDDLHNVMRRFPDADENEILLNIEDGIEENNPNQINVLAEESQTRRLSERTESETKIKEDTQVAATKEAEGGISVPQSPGSPQAPATPAAPGAAPKLGADFDGDAAWGEALSKAKAGGEGA